MQLEQLERPALPARNQARLDDHGRGQVVVGGRHDRITTPRCSTGCVRLNTILRQPDGKLRLTASGEAIAQCAETMERQVDLVNEGLGAGHGEYAGSVKLTAVPIVANRLLAPSIGKLLDRHPALQLELIPEKFAISACHAARPIWRSGLLARQPAGRV